MSRRESFITQNADTEEDAEEIYETFHAKDPRRSFTTNFEWPAEMQLVGQACAQLYRSNKWKMDPHVFEDYKHIAEGFQHCYMAPGASKSVPTYGPFVDMRRIIGDPAPSHFALMANLIAIQVNLYDDSGRLPRGDDRLYEWKIRGGKLGGARHPRTGKAFLLVYNTEGVWMIITGTKLDIKRDGIVG
jgi:hypothetical protein